MTYLVRTLALLGLAAAAALVWVYATVIAQSWEEARARDLAR